MGEGESAKVSEEYDSTTSCTDSLQAVVEAVVLSAAGSRNAGGRGREAPGGQPASWSGRAGPVPLVVRRLRPLPACAPLQERHWMVNGLGYARKTPGEQFDVCFSPSCDISSFVRFHSALRGDRIKHPSNI